MFATDAEEIRDLAKNDLLFFTAVCDPKYQIAELHEFLARELHKIATGETKRLILSLPPQHSKSRTTTVELPTWLLAFDPTWKVAVASYGQDLANRNSREARERMDTEGFRFFSDTRINPVHAAVDSWTVIGGGSYKAVGIGGPLSGHSVDLLIIDDPIKNPEEAFSATYRDKVWDWYLSVAYTRLSPRGAIILISTRWHPDDLTGRLLKAQAEGGDQWRHINFMAIAEEGDMLGRAPGEALWPQRYTIERLKQIREALGSFLWAALYEGRPTEKGGNYIDVGAFEVVLPSEVPEGLRWMRFWDLAATQKEATKASDPDYTAGVKGAIGPNGEFYLADMIAGQWEWPKARERIKNVAAAERILVGIEAVSGFKTAYANLREVLPADVMSMEVGADKDKLTRALPWIALTEARKVRLVKGDWIVAFMRQAEEFPRSAHDDMVDAVSGVYGMLTGGMRVLVA